MPAGSSMPPGASRGAEEPVVGWEEEAGEMAVVCSCCSQTKASACDVPVHVDDTRECSPFGERIVAERRGFSPRAEQHLRRVGLLHNAHRPRLPDRGVYR